MKSIAEKLSRHPRYASQIAAQSSRTGTARTGDSGERQASGAPSPRAGKYGSKRCRNHFGESFDSQLERKVVGDLRLAYSFDRIIRQVSIPVGLQRMRLDALIVHEIFEDGTFRGELVDAKGMATPEWEAKARRLKKQHGLSVRLIKK